ncbi:MAG: hypothetical protein K9J12_00935 [Melioribacteraceae bacterium]|nr:hypothetical protein [Melioribacteraceae bacterium]MCF8264728.1 hypothetical protein [Melioribacteraceae bacterium]
MKTRMILTVITFLFVLGGMNFHHAQVKDFLQGSFNWEGKRTNEIQYFVLETTMLNYQLNGNRSGKDHLKLFLECSPINKNGKDLFKYTCIKFIVINSNGVEVTIPELEGWSYVFGGESETEKAEELVFGISHSKFENLKDNTGDALSQVVTYWIYNTFIDFHAFCNVFAEPTTDGKGIQDLSRLNQKIIHSSANSEPPVNLGTNIKEGSYFKNGEISLQFIGVGIVNDAICGILNFDSGESSFKMLIEPMPNMLVTTNGASHYKGTLYINKETFWVEKVVMDEFVLAETEIPGQGKMNQVIERGTIISNVTKDEFHLTLK